MRIFLNPVVLNLFYLTMGVIAARSEGNERPILTLILFILIPNILFYMSSAITRKIIEKKRASTGSDK